MVPLNYGRYHVGNKGGIGGRWLALHGCVAG